MRLSLAVTSLLLQNALSFQTLSRVSIIAKASTSFQHDTSRTVQTSTVLFNGPIDIHHDQIHEAHPDTTTNESLQIASQLLQPHFPFPLDTWQLSAASSILSNQNVIVCAPTGSGKTVVGEIALLLALQKNTKAIYTTPLKALSNQKFVEMQKVFGSDRVGLATGDISIRRGSDVMVMTTEVYRNMAWKARSNGGDIALSSSLEDASTWNSRSEDEKYDDLSENSIVVLDEFHYMGEKGRGSTWEESVIFNPPNTQIVG